MDKREFFIFLSESLEGCSADAFRFHERFFEEFKVLLKKASETAFYERSGKKASDYTLWKQVLKRRYSEM